MEKMLAVKWPTLLPLLKINEIRPVVDGVLSGRHFGGGVVGVAAHNSSGPAATRRPIAWCWGRRPGGGWARGGRSLLGDGEGEDGEEQVEVIQRLAELLHARLPEQPWNLPSKEVSAGLSSTASALTPEPTGLPGLTTNVQTMGL